MTNLKAFYTLPNVADLQPNIVHRIGNALLIPAAMILRSNMVEYTPSWKVKTITPVEFDGSLSNVGAFVLSLILFMPSFILGTIVKAASFVDSDVRNAHKALRDHYLRL